MTNKRCSRCGKSKNESEFYDDPKHKGKQYKQSCCKPCQRSITREWQSNHPEYKRKRAENTQKLRLAVFMRLGNKCSNPYCRVVGGMDDPRALQIDHIHGGGRKEIHSFNSIDYYYHHLLSLNDDDFFSNYQLLCANCNWIKRHENDENRKPSNQKRDNSL